MWMNRNRRPKLRSMTRSMITNNVTNQNSKCFFKKLLSGHVKGNSVREVLFQQCLAPLNMLPGPKNTPHQPNPTAQPPTHIISTLLITCLLVAMVMLLMPVILKLSGRAHKALLSK